MTQEITVTISARLKHDSDDGTSLSRNFNPGSIQIDQTTARRAGHTQALTATPEVVDTGDITEGYVFLTNLDETYNVDYGPQDEGSGNALVEMGTLDPADPPAFFHLKNGITLMAVAAGGSGATADLDIEVWSV